MLYVSVWRRKNVVSSIRQNKWFYKVTKYNAIHLIIRKVFKTRISEQF